MYVLSISLKMPGHQRKWTINLSFNKKIFFKNNLRITIFRNCITNQLFHFVSFARQQTFHLLSHLICKWFDKLQESSEQILVMQAHTKQACFLSEHAAKFKEHKLQKKLSPPKSVLPSFQGSSTIFDNGNFHS